MPRRLSGAFGEEGRGAMLALTWRQDGSEGIKWYIRGIHDDGRFYGEIRFQSPDQKRRKAAFVSGQLTAAECARLAALVGVIRHEPPLLEESPRFAALWERLSSSNAGEVRPLLWYRCGEESGSEASRAFLELAGLVERHLRPFYPLIAEQTAAADRGRSQAL
jgi:hypothetical protein